MKVFLSWSGHQSRLVAQTFGKWISQVVQVVDPWMSADIDKGVRWAQEITSGLEESRVGIICLTPDNLNAPWILFEAGALSKTKGAHVCTLLMGISPGDVDQPLGQFQHTSAEDKDDVLQLIRTINRQANEQGERALAEVVLEEVFEANWPRLSVDLKAAATARPSPRRKRSDRDVLEEILQTVRSFGHQQAVITSERIAAEQANRSTDQSGAHLLLNPSAYKEFLREAVTEILSSSTRQQIRDDDEVSRSSNLVE
jgi:hypothetical protein